MGWLFSQHWQTREELLEHLVSPDRWGDNFRIIKSTHVGNNHWYVGYHVSKNERFIGLDLMQSGYPEAQGWGYKDLLASMGPVEVNCPLSYLKMAPDRGGHETGWREKVVAYHAKRKEQRAKRHGMTVGTCVKYADRYFRLCYRLLSPKGRCIGWQVREYIVKGTEQHDCELYRMTLPQLTKAEIV